MMDADHFELQLSLPHDIRLAATVRSIAVQAAQYAGCGDAEAQAFGRSVEEIVRGYLEDDTSLVNVPVTVRRFNGPLEVTIAARTITLDL